MSASASSAGGQHLLDELRNCFHGERDQARAVHVELAGPAPLGARLEAPLRQAGRRRVCTISASPRAAVGAEGEGRRATARRLASISVAAAPSPKIVRSERSSSAMYLE